MDFINFSDNMTIIEYILLSDPVDAVGGALFIGLIIGLSTKFVIRRMKHARLAG